VKPVLAQVCGGGRLSEDEAAAAMDAIMDGEATPAQIGAFLAALALRGESEDELVGFARAMRARALPCPAEDVLDTCGTGGDGACTFNISTVASFVVAAAGVRVAKHGNRSASGSCGSADVLEALGLRVDAPPERALRCLEETGWAFLFAPAFHASTRHAAGPRRELGIRTAFNLLGPLTNPARPTAQVVGVPRPEYAELLARCLKRLGLHRAWVVHGSGLDELSLSGPSEVAELEAGELKHLVVQPEAAGLPRCEVSALRGGDAAVNAGIAQAVLDGEQGPRRDVVLLNAAVALLVAGRAESLRAGALAAAEAVDSRRAARLVSRVKEILA
jgi:anthranilate phosphoribosyltransferase